MFKEVTEACSSPYIGTQVAMVEGLLDLGVLGPTFWVSSLGLKWTGPLLRNPVARVFRENATICILALEILYGPAVSGRRVEWLIDSGGGQQLQV